MTINIMKQSTAIYKISFQVMKRHWGTLCCILLNERKPSERLYAVRIHLCDILGKTTIEIVKRSKMARIWRKKGKVRCVKQTGFFRVVKLFCTTLSWWI